MLPHDPEKCYRVWPKPFKPEQQVTEVDPLAVLAEPKPPKPPNPRPSRSGVKVLRPDAVMLKHVEGGVAEEVKHTAAVLHKFKVDDCDSSEQDRAHHDMHTISLYCLGISFGDVDRYVGPDMILM